MKDRCDEESRRRASFFGRIKAFFHRNDLEKDICDLQGRLNEEHRRWTVSLERLQILVKTIHLSTRLNSHTGHCLASYT